MPITGHCGCCTPSICKSATFQNSSGTKVKLCAEFKSGDKEEHIVPNGNSVKVEKTINHGTWWAMDPLQKVKITAEGLEEYSFDVITKVIECHSYSVTSKDGKVICEKIIQDS